jgi:hypothetical protein
MIRAMSILLVACLLGMTDADHTEPPRSQPAASHFGWVDVFIDPQGKPLACYQFELTAKDADVTLAGVEGGEHAAFSQPPYYDEKANLQNRIVIAAFNTGNNLPRQRTRVARVMVRVKGGTPHYAATLQVSASADAQKIPATISTSEGASR